MCDNMVTMLHLQYVLYFLGDLGVQGIPSATIAPLCCSSERRSSMFVLCIFKIGTVARCLEAMMGLSRWLESFPTRPFWVHSFHLRFFLYVAYVIAGETSVFVLNIVKVCRLLRDLRLFMKFPSTHWTRW
jgi:hypothetical protein